MEKRILGKTGLSVSIITFGGIVVDGVSKNEASQYVCESIQRGINYFDVAPSYGNAQYMLGPALEPFRKNVYLACKTQKRTANEAKEELIESLKALKTDYLDNYQLHGLDNYEDIKTVFAKGGAMEVLIEAKQSGITKNIGFTCHQDSAALEIMQRGEFDTMLFPVNYAYREVKKGSKLAVDKALQNNLGIIAIKALAQRKWLENEQRLYPKCWYRPIYDNPDFARLALNYTLSTNITTAASPGDIRMLRLALDIIEKQNGKCITLTCEEKTMLKKYATDTENIIF